MDNCCCVYGGEYPEAVLEDKVVVARKSHTCGECACEIKPGEHYEVIKGVWDGDFSTHKTCLLCSRIRDDLMPCGHYFGAVWADLRECLELEEWMLPESLLAAGRARAERRKV